MGAVVPRQRRSDNAELGRELAAERSDWYGPVRIAFEHLHRLAGPESEPTLDRMDADDIETADDMADSLDGGWEPPPVVATWNDDHLTVEDGNHRIEGLRRDGEREWWTLVGFHGDDDRSDFLEALANDLA